MTADMLNTTEEGSKAAPKTAGDKDEPKKFLSPGRTKKKACRFCTDKDFVLDYKNVRVIQTFLSEHGRIVPRRISGNCATHQRSLTTAIKQGRQLALVGYTSSGTF